MAEWGEFAHIDPQDLAGTMREDDEVRAAASQVVHQSPSCGLQSPSSGH